MAPVPTPQLVVGGALTFVWVFVGEPLGIVCTLAGLVILFARPR